MYYNIANADIHVDTSVLFIYSGEPNEPKIFGTYRNNEIVENTDYELSYENNINAGYGKVIVTGIGDFFGEVEFEFEIAPLSIASGSIVVDDPDDDGYYALSGLKVIFNEKEMNYESEFIYSVSSSNPTDTELDIYTTISVYGVGNYTGRIREEYKTRIKFIGIDTMDIELSEDIFVYNAQIQKPTLETELIENQDYIANIPDSKDAASYTISIIGIGSYFGLMIARYTIEKCNIEEAHIICGNQDEDGCYDLDNLEVWVENVLLREDIDYIISVSEMEIDNGYIQSTCFISGTNNYFGDIFKDIITKKKTIYVGKEIELKKAKVYPRFGSIKTNIIKDGIYYVWDEAIKNHRIRITTNKEDIGVNGQLTGWIDVDDIFNPNRKISLGDRVIVNGNINVYADGSGNIIYKNKELMYVVDILDPDQFEFNIGVATSRRKRRQGWANLEMIKRYDDPEVDK